MTRSKAMIVLLVVMMGFDLACLVTIGPVSTGVKLAWAAMSKTAASSVGAHIVLPEEDPLDIRGEIDMVAAGSAAMYPIMRSMYKRFVKEGYRGEMKIRRIGTAMGFKLLCREGKVDILMASRTIRAHEIEACEAIGLQPVELNVGLDALTVVANIHNQFVDDILEEDLQLIFSANRWSDVNETWPDRLIERIIPALGTGTFDFFVDLIFDGEAESILSAANTTMEKDHKFIAREVGMEVDSIGLVGHAYYKRHKASLRAVPIDGIIPSRETVESADYILTRPFLLYADAAVIRQKPQVRAFLAFLLNRIGAEIEKVGYFSTSAPMLNGSKALLLEVIEKRQ